MADRFSVGAEAGVPVLLHIFPQEDRGRVRIYQPKSAHTNATYLTLSKLNMLSECDTRKHKAGLWGSLTNLVAVASLHTWVLEQLPELTLGL